MNVDMDLAFFSLADAFERAGDQAERDAALCDLQALFLDEAACLARIALVNELEEVDVDEQESSISSRPVDQSEVEALLEFGLFRAVREDQLTIRHIDAISWDPASLKRVHESLTDNPLDVDTTPPVVTAGETAPRFSEPTTPAARALTLCGDESYVPGAATIHPQGHNDVTTRAKKSWKFKLMSTAACLAVVVCGAGAAYVVNVKAQLTQAIAKAGIRGSFEFESIRFPQRADQGQPVVASGWLDARYVEGATFRVFDVETGEDVFKDPMELDQTTVSPQRFTSQASIVANGRLLCAELKVSVRKDVLAEFPEFFPEDRLTRQRHFRVTDAGVLIDPSADSIVVRLPKVLSTEDRRGQIAGSVYESGYYAVFVRAKREQEWHLQERGFAPAFRSFSATCTFGQGAMAPEEYEVVALFWRQNPDEFEYPSQTYDSVWGPAEVLVQPQEPPEQDVDIGQITRPLSGSTVFENEIVVRGRVNVSNLNGRWPIIAVKPSGHDRWYVQQLIDQLDEHGHFASPAIIGDPSTEDGTQFKVRLALVASQGEAGQLADRAVEQFPGDGGFREVTITKSSR